MHLPIPTPAVLLNALRAQPWLNALRHLGSASPVPRGSTLLAHAPKPRLGHWRIRCTPAVAGNPVRVVRVLSVDPTTRALLAWCEWCNRPLTLALDQIDTAADLHTGRLVDLARWWAGLGASPAHTAPGSVAAAALPRP